MILFLKTILFSRNFSLAYSEVPNEEEEFTEDEEDYLQFLCDRGEEIEQLSNADSSISSVSDFVSTYSI